MQKFLEEKREEIAELCRTHHVRRLAVFGSAVRSDFDPERSDIDFVVDFQPVDDKQYFRNKMELIDELQRVSGRPVDLVVARWVRNSHLKREIEATQELLYAA
jgi:predicted nucleotidyltransferase